MSIGSHLKWYIIVKVEVTASSRRGTDLWYIAEMWLN